MNLNNRLKSLVQRYHDSSYDVNEYLGLAHNMTEFRADLSSEVISRVVNREKYLEVIFFSAQPFVGERSPPTPIF